MASGRDDREQREEWVERPRNWIPGAVAAAVLLEKAQEEQARKWEKEQEERAREERREKACKQVPGLDDDFKRLDEEIKDLKASVASRTREKEEMAAKAEAAEKDRDALKAENTELEQRIETLQASHEKSLSDTKEQLSEVARRAQAAEKSLAATERRLDVLKAERAELQSRLDKEIQEEGQKLKEVIAEKEACTEEFKAKLEAAKKEMQTSVQEYEDRISEILQENETLQQQRARQAEETEELRKSIASIQEETEDKSARLREAQQVKDDLTSRLQEAEAARAVLLQERAELQTRVQSLQEAEEQLQRRLDRQEAQLGRTVSKHLEEVEEMKQKKEILKKELLKQNQEMRQLEKAYQEMKEKLQASKELITSLKDGQAEAREALYRQLQEMQLEHGDAKSLMASYMGGLQQGQADIATAVERMSSRQDAHYQEMAEYTQALASQAQPPPHSQDTQRRLPQDALHFCLQIQTLIGGNGKQFARQLLGGAFSQGPDVAGFASTQDFWRLVETWVQEAKPDDVSKAALQRACEGLHPSPVDDQGEPLQEMALQDRLRLERNFQFLREHVLVAPLVDALRTSGLLTEDARHFLLEEPLPRSQRTARLCDVIISWGNKGLPALIQALKDSDQSHVAIQLQEEPQQTRLPETTARQEQQSQAACPDSDTSRPLTEEEQRLLEELENSGRPASVRDLETAMQRQRDLLLQAFTAKMEASIDSLQTQLQTVSEGRHDVIQEVYRVFNEVHADLRRGFKMDG